MGEMMGTETSQMSKEIESDKNQGFETSTTKFKTEIDGIEADGIVKRGNVEFSVFDVDEKSFYSNMKEGRKRIVFTKDTPAQKYMQAQKYKKDFYIRHTDSNGKTLMRKVQ